MEGTAMNTVAKIGLIVCIIGLCILLGFVVYLMSQFDLIMSLAYMAVILVIVGLVMIGISGNK